MKKFLNILFSRASLLILIFTLQILLILWIVIQFQKYVTYLYIISMTLSFFLILSLINSNILPEYKIAWIIPIMLFPAFGWVLYRLFSKNSINVFSRKAFLESYKKNFNKKIFSTLNLNLLQNLKQKDIFATTQANYLINYAGSEIFTNCDLKYYKLGEFYFEDLLIELKNAQKFIFMEYFIIKEGKMWNSILDILKEKAKNGLEVRLIFDDLGCINTLPKNYKSILKSYNIKCEIFNPVNFIFIPIYNNRTHRKITIIDGKVAFTGGINISDEYINKVTRFGHWKDTGISIKGEGVWGFTHMFLISWNFITKSYEDFSNFKVENFDNNYEKNYIIPFSDSPLDNEIISHNVYLSLIQNATKYIYINTPYLIVGQDIINSLCYASKKGVKVIISTPHIPDKKMVFEVTRSNYEVLIKSGVEIYEYKKGFLHAKSFIVDDKYAVIGTINLDYRSLYLHFECGVWIYNSNVIFDMKKDYLETLNLCKKITLDECKNISKIKKLYRLILKVFAPLM